MPVTDTHSEYDENIASWKLVRDCVKGSKAIKAAKQVYLPKPNPEDNSDLNNLRYQDYIKRANFVGFTGSTQEGMLGMVFRKDMEIELPAALEYIKANATGAGLSLQQLTQDIIGDTLETGRIGLLADYPQAEEGLTQAQVQSLKLMASIKPYATENIINWRTHTIGSVTSLSMVVLKEPTEVVNDDGFGSKMHDYHRVLLIDNGNYIQRLYDEDGEQIGEDIEPKKSDGSRWKEIPFIFVGSKNNDPTTDKAPLYDIAEVNVSHYISSAEFEDNAYHAGQSTPVINGLTQGWVDANMKDGVVLGSANALLLPENADAKLLQTAETTMAERAMEAKEQQMIKIGARIIQDSTGSETAEAARIRFGGQNSKLSLIVGNVESGLLTVLAWVGEFMGVTDDSIIEINRQFYDKNIDPQILAQGMMMLDRRLWAKTDMRGIMRHGGLIGEDRTDEDIDAEAEGINPLE